MAKTQEVQTQMMAALKAGNKPRKDALSLLLAALKNKQIDKRAPLTEAEEDAVILREIKEAQETIDTTPADRTAVMEECRARIAVYREFAPVQMDEARAAPDHRCDAFGARHHLPDSRRQGPHHEGAHA